MKKYIALLTMISSPSCPDIELRPYSVVVQCYTLYVQPTNPNSFKRIQDLSEKIDHIWHKGDAGPIWDMHYIPSATYVPSPGWTEYQRQREEHQKYLNDARKQSSRLGGAIPDTELEEKLSERLQYLQQTEAAKLKYLAQSKEERLEHLAGREKERLEYFKEKLEHIHSNDTKIIEDQKKDQKPLKNFQYPEKKQMPMTYSPEEGCLDACCKECSKVCIQQ